mgnify:CR=1 FL=1|tara:strand:+ start:73257 stop:75515 length:2259 start_codon:yes stop_codon:yes gene_type:complete
MPQTVKRTSNLIYVTSDVDCTIDIYLRGDSVYEIQDTYAYTVPADPYYFYTILEDGLYKVIVTVSGTPTETILPMFPSLISNIATEFKSFVCSECKSYLEDCGCNNLTDAAKTAIKYNNLATKILYLEASVLLGYSDIDRVNYQNFLFNVLKTISCKADSLLAKIIAEECIKGMSENSELYKLLIILRFFGTYLLELNNSSNFGDTILPPVVDVQGATTPTIIDLPELYLYDSWYECLCDTCLRVEEAITIFTDGIDDTADPVTNLPPLGADIYVNVDSGSASWNYDLNAAIFNAVFSDDTLSFPVSVKVVAIPAWVILEDTGDVAVTPGQVIPFEDIANYRANYSGVPVGYSDFFTFRFSDGILESPVYRFNIALIATVNYPPNIINGFNVELPVNGSVLIRKSQLFNVGSVVDAEGDIIDLARLESVLGTTVEIWDGVSAYVSLSVASVITLADFSDNGEFLKVTRAIGPQALNHNIVLAFHDVGSGLYSNDSSIGNVMVITNSILQVTALTFTGGILSQPKAVKGWIPLSRIEYSGEYKNLTLNNVVQTGYASAVLDYLIKPATADEPWDVYDNSASLVIPNTTNPTLNTYDIYVFTDVLNDRAVTYDVEESGVKVLSVTTSINMETIGNDTPIKISFLEFTETDIADFNYLEVPATFPADFVNTDALSNLDVDYDASIGGQDYTIITPGLIGFALYTDEIRNPTIYDSLGNDVTTTAFKKFFDASKGLELYISLNVYAPSTLYLRFEF